MLNWLICVSGTPIELIASETLRWKVQEPVLLLGKQRFQTVDIRIRAQGGGHVSQIYAIRQAIAKGLVAFYQKCMLVSTLSVCFLALVFLAISMRCSYTVTCASWSAVNLPAFGS